MLWDQTSLADTREEDSGASGLLTPSMPPGKRGPGRGRPKIGTSPSANGAALFRRKKDVPEVWFINFVAFLRRIKSCRVADISASRERALSIVDAPDFSNWSLRFGSLLH